VRAARLNRGAKAPRYAPKLSARPPELPKDDYDADKSPRFRLFASVLAIAFWGPLHAHAKRASKTAAHQLPYVDRRGSWRYDRGGFRPERFRKEMTLESARLRRHWRQRVSRGDDPDSDVFVPLGTRRSRSPTLMSTPFSVSIHFNSAKRSGAGGIETIFLQPGELPLASAIHYFAGEAPSSNRNVRRRVTSPAKSHGPGSGRALTNPTEARSANGFLPSKARGKNCHRCRGRNSVASALTTTRVATSERHPVCNRNIDQTKVANLRAADPSSHKKSARRKKSHRNQTSQRQKRLKRSEGIFGTSPIP